MTAMTANHGPVPTTAFRIPSQPSACTTNGNVIAPIARATRLTMRAARPRFFTGGGGSVGFVTHEPEPQRAWRAAQVALHIDPPDAGLGRAVVLDPVLPVALREGQRTHT